MNPSPENRGKLEHVVHRTLRKLPPRRAPHSLEQRVRAELERRAALPWWRKSFVHWPLAARAGFVVLCAGLVKLALMSSVWGAAGFNVAPFTNALAEPVLWMENGVVVVRAITDFFNIMLRNIPALWLYGGLVFFATLYATLFGLGAAAVKALRAPR
jgi:hypothetical protein